MPSNFVQLAAQDLDMGDLESHFVQLVAEDLDMGDLESSVTLVQSLHTRRNESIT